MIEKTVVTIRGPANSGKTTLAHVIAAKIREQQNQSIMLISQDNVRHEILWMPKPDQRAVSIDLMKELTNYAAGHVDVLIIEGILSAAHHEDFLQHVKTLYGCNCHSYYIDLSLEDARQRYREMPREEYEIGSLDKWYIEADYSSVLMERILDGRLSADSLAETICRDITGRE